MTAPRRRRRTGTTFATAAALAAVVAVGFVVFVVNLASSGTVKNQLGEATFPAGRAVDFAREVASGGPLLFPDPLGGPRQVYLQHLGADPALGWVVVQAVPPGEKAACVLAWHQDRTVFTDPCTAATYPADGAGLTRYPATVLRNGRVNVDLRVPLPGGATVTTGTAP